MTDLKTRRWDALERTDTISAPLRWRKSCIIDVGDPFIPSAPYEEIDRIFAVMALAPQHAFLVLTKHPDRMLYYFKHHFTRSKCSRKASEISGIRDSEGGGDIRVSDGQFPFPNVGIGIHIENQDDANKNIPLLLQTPAAMRWLYCKAAAIDFYECSRVWSEHGYTPWLNGPILLDIKWLVCAGDSSPVHPDWVRSLRDQCVPAGVHFMFERWGDWKPVTEEAEVETYPTFIKRDASDARHTQSNCHHLFHQVWACVTDPKYGWRYPVIKVGKKAAGRLLDGVVHDDVPEMLRDADPLFKFKTAALQAQRKVIFTWLLEHYVGDGRKIAKWDDWRFRLSSFMTVDIVYPATLATIRRNLAKMAAAEVISLRNEYERPGAMLRYSFPRDICDKFAAEAIEHYKSIGYSQDEIRDKVAESEKA